MSTPAQAPVQPLGELVIRRLGVADAGAFHALRLAGLQSMPSAFGSSYQEEKDFPHYILESRLAPAHDRGVFGAFAGSELVGLVTLGREGKEKLAHKAMIWGMYVAPSQRGQGVGGALLDAAVALARSVPDIRQVNLSVNASNQPAQRLYASRGFMPWGHEKGSLRVDGVLHDEIHMSLLLR